MSDQEAASGVDESIDSASATETGGESVEQIIERMLPDDGATEEASESPKAKARKADEPDEAEDADAGDDEDTEDERAESDDSSDEDEDLPEPKDEDEDEEPEDEEAALEHAYEVLLKSKRAPFSVLKSTPKAKLIAWAQQVEDEQASASKGASESAETERGAQKTAKAEEADPARGASDKAWPELRAAAAKQLGVDEESLEWLKPLHDRAAKAEGLTAEFEALRAEIRERDGRELINRELRRLESVYPTLKSSEKKSEKVIDEAMTRVAGLKSRGKRVDAEAVFTKAAETVLGKPKRADLPQLRRNGFATAPTGTREGLDTTKSDAEYWDKAVTHAQAGRIDLIRKLRPPQREEAKNGRRGL